MPKVKPTDEEMLNRKLQGRIRDLQIQRKVTDEQIATAGRMARTTFQGKMKNPGKFKVEEYRRIFRYLGAQPEDLLVGLWKGESR